MDYKDIYRNAVAEVDTLARRIAETEQSLASMQRELIALLGTVSAIGQLLDEEVPEHLKILIHQNAKEAVAAMGMTEQIRLILGIGIARSATEIRDILQSGGFDLSEYSNALATIHNVLRRLVEKDEIKVTTDGKRYYIPTQEVEPPLRTALTLRYGVQKKKDKK
jgi:hypothetical protein